MPQEFVFGKTRRLGAIYTSFIVQMCPQLAKRLVTLMVQTCNIPQGLACEDVGVFGSVASSTPVAA